MKRTTIEAEATANDDEKEIPHASDAREACPKIPQDNAYHGPGWTARQPQPQHGGSLIVFVIVVIAVRFLMMPARNLLKCVTNWA